MAVTASTAELVYGAGTITIRPTPSIARRTLGRHNNGLHMKKTVIVTTHNQCWHLLLSRNVEETTKRIATDGPSEIASEMSNIVILRNMESTWR
jgi:ribosomal protein S17